MPIRISGSTGISGLDGSATTPVLQGASANSGIYYSGNTIFVSTSGTNAMTIGPSGNVSFANSSVSIGGQAISSAVGMRNRIINGAMVIDQRNSGSSITATNAAAYSVDRWRTYSSTSSKFNVQQTPSSTETNYSTRIAAGFTNYLGCTSTSSYTLSSTDQMLIWQPIEGYNLADLAWGTANAKTITLSFWVYSSLTGTFSGSLQNASQNRCCPFPYTISNANTWTQISVTISGDTTGTWNITNGIGVLVFFSLGTGSTYTSTANTWTGSSFITSVPGATSVVATSGATFYITGVQFEVGSVATPFEFRHYTNELALCQRYYAAQGSGGFSGMFYDTIGTSYNNLSSSRYAYHVGVTLPVQMRTSPTITFTMWANSDQSSNFGVTWNDGRSLRWRNDNSGFNPNTDLYVTYKADAEL